MNCCNWIGKGVFQSTAGGGGGGGPGGLPVFDDLAALAAFAVESSQDGLVVWVKTLHDAFEYQLSNQLGADGITVVAPPSNTGRWLRLKLPNESWAHQSSWFIDAKNGSDENDGQEGRPLRTHAELERRIHGLTLSQATKVTILTDLPEVIHLDVRLGDVPPHVGTLTYVGSPSIIRSGTLAAGGTAIDANSNTPSTIVDSTIDWDTAGPSGASLIGQRIRITNSSATGVNGAIAWLAKRIDATTARTSTFLVSGSLTVMSPVAGDSYVVETLTQVSGLDLTVRGRLDTNACTIDSLAIGGPTEPIFDSQLAGDGAEAGYFVTGCSVHGQHFRVERGRLFNCKLVSSHTQVNISGTSIQIIGGMKPPNCFYFIDSFVALSFDAHHLVQGGGTEIGLQIAGATHVAAGSLAVFDSAPPVILGTGASMAITSLWGTGNTIGVLIAPGAIATYGVNVPTIQGTPRFVVGGTNVGNAGEQTAPFFNTANGAGLVESA